MSYTSRRIRNQRLRHYPLMTPELRQRLPQPHVAMAQSDPIAWVKYYFTPSYGWFWYAAGFDGDQWFYGLVFGFKVQLGRFSLIELDMFTGPGKLPVERDTSFKPQPLSQILIEHDRLKDGHRG